MERPQTEGDGNSRGLHDQGTSTGAPSGRFPVDASTVLITAFFRIRLALSIAISLERWGLGPNPSRFPKRSECVREHHPQPWTWLFRLNTGGRAEPLET